MNCIFCRVVAGEVSSDVVYEDEGVLAFRDVAPQAPVHVLLVPKQHVETVPVLCDPDDPASRFLLSFLLGHVGRVAAHLGLPEKGGYRIVLNVGPGAGQVVPHLHIHILAGWAKPPSI